MAESRLVLRADRVEALRYTEGALGVVNALPFVRLLTGGHDPEVGDLFLTNDGVVGFQKVVDKKPKWASRLAEISKVDGTVKTFGPLSASLGNEGRMLRLSVEGNPWTIRFLGIIPKGSAGGALVEAVAEELVPFGAGHILGWAKSQYEQRKALPEEHRLASSPGDRAKQACAWWLTVLRGEVPQPG